MIRIIRALTLQQARVSHVAFLVPQLVDIASHDEGAI